MKKNAGRMCDHYSQVYKRENYDYSNPISKRSEEGAEVVETDEEEHEQVPRPPPPAPTPAPTGPAHPRC